MKSIRSLRRSALGVVISSALLAGPLAACSSSTGAASTSPSISTPSGSGTTMVDAAAHTLLPASIVSSGKITVASSIGFAPFELYGSDGKTLEGLDIDLIHAIEPILGVKFEISDVRYPNILPSLQAKRYMIGWSAFGETPDAEKVVDFVTYLGDSAGEVLVPSSTSAITKTTDLCGKSIGQVNGEPLASIDAINSACTSAGKPKVQTKMFQKTADIVLALESGQLDMRLSDQANGGYIVKQSGGKLKLVNGVLPQQKFYSGVVVPKGQDGLTKALQAALQDLVTNGTYASILTKWGAQAGAVTSITLGMPSS
jgi:polar amino acid transport system substrate-binding protein